MRRLLPLTLALVLSAAVVSTGRSATLVDAQEAGNHSLTRVQALYHPRSGEEIPTRYVFSMRSGEEIPTRYATRSGEEIPTRNATRSGEEIPTRY